MFHSKGLDEGQELVERERSRRRMHYREILQTVNVCTYFGRRSATLLWGGKKRLTFLLSRVVALRFGGNIVLPEFSGFAVFQQFLGGYNAIYNSNLRVTACLPFGKTCCFSHNGRAIVNWNPYKRSFAFRKSARCPIQQECMCERSRK
jgi:hypothetical protein